MSNLKRKKPQHGRGERTGYSKTRDTSTVQDRPGRPAYKPNEAHRTVVSVLRGCGIPLKVAAIRCGVSEETLRKYYPDEIADAMPHAEAYFVMCLATLARHKPQAALGYLDRVVGGKWKKQAEDDGGDPDGILPGVSITIRTSKPLDPRRVSREMGSILELTAEPATDVGGTPKD